jgi:hypothetical protein
MSQRSKLVQAGRMMSANRASPSNQMDWFTTNPTLPSRYACTYLFVSVMVPMKEPP